MPDSFSTQNKAVEAPPEPEIAIRTMESDIRSIEENGGQAPVAVVINPSYVFPTTEEVEELTTIPAHMNIRGYRGPEKGIFEPTTIAVENQASGKARIIITIVAIVVVGVGLWLLGYFVIFPWIAKR